MSLTTVLWWCPNIVSLALLESDYLCLYQDLFCWCPNITSFALMELDHLYVSAKMCFIGVQHSKSCIDGFDYMYVCWCCSIAGLSLMGLDLLYVCIIYDFICPVLARQMPVALPLTLTQGHTWTPVCSSRRRRYMKNCSYTVALRTAWVKMRFKSSARPTSFSCKVVLILINERMYYWFNTTEFCSHCSIT